VRSDYPFRRRYGLNRLAAQGAQIPGGWALLMNPCGLQMLVWCVVPTESCEICKPTAILASVIRAIGRRRVLATRCAVWRGWSEGQARDSGTDADTQRRFGTEGAVVLTRRMTVVGAHWALDCHKRAQCRLIVAS
jgi:hypothetical protein